MIVRFAELIEKKGVARIYIINANKEVTFAEWYDYGTHFEEGSVIIDTSDNTVTYDGVNWIELKEYEF